MEFIKIATGKNYIIKTGLLIDVHTGKAAPERTLYLENGRVWAVTGNNYSPLHFSNPDLETINLDLGRLSVLPPMVDCHVHLALDGIDFTSARQRWDRPAELHNHLKDALRDTLHHGILAVRDGGDRRRIALGCRDYVQSGKLPGPKIFASGFALRKPHNYGSFLGRGTPMEAMDGTLAELAMHGVDQIKVLVSGIVSFNEYGVVGPPQYTLKELKAITEGARARGLNIMAHASSDEAVSMAITAGAASIEHGYFLSTRSLELMAEKDIAWVPTVIPVAAQLAHPGALDRQQRYVIEKTVDRHLLMINKAASMGIALGVGTDAGATGVRHGHGYLQELKLYRQAGLSPAQILRCATLSGIQILNSNSLVNAFIAVRGNPLDNIEALQNIKCILQPAE